MNERLSQRIEADYQFTQTLMLLDYEKTGEVLKAINDLFLSGETVEEILFILNSYKITQ